MKWEYMCIRSDSRFLTDLEAVLSEGYEPFFVTVEDGKRYVHVRRQS